MREVIPTMSDSKPGLDDPLPAAGESVAELYDRYASQVERWARRLGGPGLDPEDLLHDIFLVVLRRRHEFRGEAKLSTWLFRITQKVVRWRRRNAAVRRWLWGRHGEDVAEAHARVPTPVEELERREQSLRLYAALDRLPEKYRTVLVLFALEGLPGEEIAALLDTDPNTVWVRLHRARAKLAELLLEGKARQP